MAMTKAELVEIVCEKTAFPRQESAEFVERVFAIMKETLEKGQKIKISGFGNFVVREKRPRKGRNPKTGSELTISARRVLTFKPSLVLRKAVNKGVLSSAKFGVSEEGPNEIENL
jgi:integration host factor subunit alpha